MSNSEDSTKPVPRGGGGRPKKKAPNHFKAAGTSLVAGLLAGADQVAERSFLGGANLDSEAGGPTAQTPPKSGRSVPPQASEAPPAAQPPTPTTPIGSASSASPVFEAPPGADIDAGTGARAQARVDAEPGTGGGPRAAKSPATLASPPSPAARRAAAPDDVRLSARVAEAPSAAPVRTIAEPKAVVREPEPEPEPVATPVRRDPAPVDDEASPTRRRMRVSGKPWAHTAVHESFASAKIRSEGWTSYGFRLDPEVLAELKERLKTDRRTSGNPMLSQGHYLDAALRHIPEDVPSQIAMAQAFLDDRMGVVDAGKQSTFRVGPEAYALVSSLNQGLQEADYGRRGLYVVSAALELLMQAMDAEGELRRPERRTKAQRPAAS
ncbi:hypothetical protein AB0451_32890 [Streptomyces sp. NPDC052000]|uniref:hypothetical protein n=1 Tax=Streptomyces sp. NPDC052000 TaxID=3155676 RepID=UPI003450FA85